MSDHSSALAQRALILLRQHRYDDAENYFREAIGVDPENSSLYILLAQAQLQQDRGEKRAVDTIEHAIRLNPQNDEAFALKAHILVSLKKPAEGLKAAEIAVGLDPNSSMAFTAKTIALLSLSRWAEAEAAARRALSIDPDDVTASNLLAQALRLQNKMQENADQIRYSLEKDPENSFTHANAGWSALQSGDRVTAENHFAEALRLDPSDSNARAGMLESFKARSAFYRAYLAYCFFMQRFAEKYQFAIVIGLLVFIKVAGAVLTGPLRILYYPLLALYLMFCLWSHLARGVGGLILMTDRKARHILNGREKLEAVVVGGGVSVGLLCIVGSLLSGVGILILVAMTLIGMAFPFAYTFTNESRLGRWLFGSFGTFVVLTGIVAFINDVGSLHLPIGFMFGLSLLMVMATTWLANVKALRS